MREIAAPTHMARGLGHIGAKSPSGRHNRKNRQFCIRCGIGVTESSEKKERICDTCRSVDPWFVKKVGL